MFNLDLKYNLSNYLANSLVLGSKSLEQLANREHTRTYKLQKEDFIICLVRSIERQAQPIESRICRILIKPK